MNTPKIQVPAVTCRGLRDGVFVILTGLLLGLSGCAATPGDTSDGADGGRAASYPDPMEKQLRMQEEMSRVTRSFL